MPPESLQDCPCLQSRKRPSPALAPNASDGGSEDLVCGPQAHKHLKLSKLLEDEPKLELTRYSLNHRNVAHRMSCSHNDDFSCCAPLGGLSSGLVPRASEDTLMLNAGDDASSSNYLSITSSSSRDQTRPISEASEYRETILQLIDPTLI